MKRNWVTFVGGSLDLSVLVNLSTSVLTEGTSSSTTSTFDHPFKFTVHNCLMTSDSYLVILSFFKGLHLENVNVPRIDVFGFSKIVLSREVLRPSPSQIMF